MPVCSKIGINSLGDTILPSSFCQRINASAPTSRLELGEYFGGNLYEREVRYLVEHEWAQQPDDILWRRTKAGLHMSPEQRSRFSLYMEGIAPQLPA